MNALSFLEVDQCVKGTLSNRKTLTSAVQAPELDGWKKLSTVAISLARLSSALEPARYVFIFTCPPLLNGAER